MKWYDDDELFTELQLGVEIMAIIVRVKVYKKCLPQMCPVGPVVWSEDAIVCITPPDWITPTPWCDTIIYKLSDICITVNLYPGGSGGSGSELQINLILSVSNKKQGAGHTGPASSAPHNSHIKKVWKVSNFVFKVKS